MQPHLHSDTENKENKNPIRLTAKYLHKKTLVENQQRITTTTNKRKKERTTTTSQTRNLTITSSRECVCLGQQIGPWFAKFCTDSILEAERSLGSIENVQKSKH